MDRTFFEGLNARRDDFRTRSEAPSVAIEIAIHGGRVFRCDAIVDAGEHTLQFDGVDRANDEVPLSLAIPYHQVASVTFVREREKMARTGF